MEHFARLLWTKNRIKKEKVYIEKKINKKMDSAPKYIYIYKYILKIINLEQNCQKKNIEFWLSTNFGSFVLFFSWGIWARGQGGIKECIFQGIRETNAYLQINGEKNLK